MAEVIRDALERELSHGTDRATRWGRALSAIGKFRDRDSATDAAERHDDYLTEIYEEGLR